ncbi:MAG: multiheme c-type cytochrome [bacterium]
MFLIKRKTTAGILLTPFILFVFQSYVSAQTAEDQDNETRSNPPQAQYTAEGVAGCLRCHAGDHSSVVAETAHGNKDNPHTPYATHGCESCHGPGSFHSSRARGGVGFPALLVFRPWASTELNNQACINCHGKDMGELAGMTSWKGSAHESRGMTCVYCHESHVTFDKMKDQELQREQCSKCHSRKLETHMGGETLLARSKCSDCHKVHELTLKE